MRIWKGLDLLYKAQCFNIKDDKTDQEIFDAYHKYDPNIEKSFKLNPDFLIVVSYPQYLIKPGQSLPLLSFSIFRALERNAWFTLWILN